MATIPSLVFNHRALQSAAHWCNAAAGAAFTAAAILWCLNALATAIECSYQAGQSCGLLLKPLLRQLWEEIDWRDVAAIVVIGLLLTAIGSWRLLLWSHRTLVALSEQLGQHTSALMLRMTQARTSPAVPRLTPSATTETSATQAIPAPRNTRRPRRRSTAVAAARPVRQPQPTGPKARGMQAPRGFAISTR